MQSRTGTRAMSEGHGPRGERVEPPETYRVPEGEPARMGKRPVLDVQRDARDGLAEIGFEHRQQFGESDNDISGVSLRDVRHGFRFVPEPSLT